MKKLIFNVAALMLLAVACNSGNNESLNNRTDDSNIQREEAAPSDVDMSEDSATGAGPTGSDIGTNRGAGSAAGSSDAAGMGMDE